MYPSCTRQAILGVTALRKAAPGPPPSHCQPRLRLSLLPDLRERDDKMSPLGVRALELGLPVDVTLCKAIGRGLSGCPGRPVGLGPDCRANVEQT